MGWFGGFVLRGRKNNIRIPEDSLLLRDGNIGVWSVPQGASGDVRVVSEGDRWIAVFGVCGADEADLLSFSIHNGKTEIDRWAGSYTIVLCEGRGINVSTDIANTRPIYIADTEYGLVWASSSRELASLVGDQINLAWLGGQN